LVESEASRSEALAGAPDVGVVEGVPGAADVPAAAGAAWVERSASRGPDSRSQRALSAAGEARADAVAQELAAGAELEAVVESSPWQRALSAVVTAAAVAAARSRRKHAMNTSSTQPFEVRAALSATPLARRHEQTLAGKLARLPKALPWSAFRHAEHPKAALALATDLWLGLARGEYGAVGLFAKIASAMTAAGAPFDLVYAATIASADETRHAEYCLRMASLSQGEEAALAVDPTELDVHLAPIENHEELDLTLVNAVAISETLATALLTACQRRASERLSRSLLTALVSDEVHHARLGWYYLAHRAPAWTTAERQRLADAAAEVVTRVEEEFWVGRDAPPSASSAARALGVLDSKTQRAVIRDVMENEIVPGLDALGFGASRAWPLRRRGGRRARR
jgi:hypothetical protein